MIKMKRIVSLAAVTTFSASALAQSLVDTNVKFPVAFVIEGGKGDPWNDLERSNHTPLWRIYLCFENTSELQTRQVTLDLAKLGTPVEKAFIDPVTKEKLAVSRLDKVVLDYTYATQINHSPTIEYTYGGANLNVKSQQSWELVYKKPEFNESRYLFDQIDFFDVQISTSVFVGYSDYTFNLGEEMYYLSNRFLKFSHSSKDSRLNFALESCEKSNQPYVLEVGEEIIRFK